MTSPIIGLWPWMSNRRESRKADHLDETNERNKYAHLAKETNKKKIIDLLTGKRKQ